MQKTITDYPAIKAALDECQEKVQALIGVPVSISYKLKFHYLSTELLASIVCEVCEVSWNEIKGDRRTLAIVVGRQIYCYLAHTLQNKTLHQIATIINRDHTSVLHAKEKIKAMIENNDELYMPLYMECLNRINEASQQ